MLSIWLFYPARWLFGLQAVVDARLEKNLAVMAAARNVTPVLARQLQAKGHAHRARLARLRQLLEPQLAPCARAAVDRAMMVRQLVTTVLIR